MKKLGIVVSSPRVVLDRGGLGGTLWLTVRNSGAAWEGGLCAELGAPDAVAGRSGQMLSLAAGAEKSLRLRIPVGDLQPWRDASAVFHPLRVHVTDAQGAGVTVWDGPVALFAPAPYRPQDEPWRSLRGLVPYGTGPLPRAFLGHSIASRVTAEMARSGLSCLALPADWPLAAWLDAADRAGLRVIVVLPARLAQAQAAELAATASAHPSMLAWLAPSPRKPSRTRLKALARHDPLHTVLRAGPPSSGGVRAARPTQGQLPPLMLLDGPTPERAPRTRSRPPPPDRLETQAAARIGRSLHGREQALLSLWAARIGSRVSDLCAGGKTPPVLAAVPRPALAGRTSAAVFETLAAALRGLEAAGERAKESVKPPAVAGPTVWCYGFGTEAPPLAGKALRRLGTRPPGKGAVLMIAAGKCGRAATPAERRGLRAWLAGGGRVVLWRPARLASGWCPRPLRFTTVRPAFPPLDVVLPRSGGAAALALDTPELDRAMLRPAGASGDWRPLGAAVFYQIGSPGAPVRCAVTGAELCWGGGRLAVLTGPAAGAMLQAWI